MRLFKQTLVMGVLMVGMTSFGQNESTNAEIVKDFLGGFNDGNNLKHSFQLLDEEYTFKNPLLELHSKADFIPLANQIGEAVTEIEIINTVEQGNWVVVSYDFKTEIPGVESNFATEWFRIESGKIMESHLIYDATEWRKIYAQMEQ